MQHFFSPARVRAGGWAVLWCALGFAAALVLSSVTPGGGTQWAVLHSEVVMASIWPTASAAPTALRAEGPEAESPGAVAPEALAPGAADSGAAVPGVVPAVTASGMPPACAAIMQRLITSEPAHEWPPPCPLTNATLAAAFQGPDGSMPITRDFCIAQRYEGELVRNWTEEYVDTFCADFLAGRVPGTYGLEAGARVRNALQQLPGGVVNSTGMVLGSEFPWAECMALLEGAAAVWTFEYATIRSTHPRIFAKPTKVMAADYLAGEIPLVDWIATWSSLEHSGLGRYGDAINPDGDKEAVEEAWCMLKPGGYFIFAVPMTCSSGGMIEFNAHRIYGWQRLAYVLQGFELVGYSERCNFIPAGGTDTVIMRKGAALSGEGAPKLTVDDFRIALERFGV